MTRPSRKHRPALAHLRKQQCDKAHEIVMSLHDKLACRVHGLVHRIEGDTDNARYWYGRAGVPLRRSLRLAAELKAIESALDAAA
jgi:hypothetical protein